MSLHEHLDTLRQENAEIETVTYMDIGSGMVLYTSAKIRPRQEILDALCATASTLLGGADGSTETAVALKPAEACVLRRSPDETSEAICVVCAPDAQIEKILDGVSGAFGHIND